MIQIKDDSDAGFFEISPESLVPDFDFLAKFIGSDTIDQVLDNNNDTDSFPNDFSLLDCSDNELSVLVDELMNSNFLDIESTAIPANANNNTPEPESDAKTAIPEPQQAPSVMPETPPTSPHPIQVTVIDSSNLTTATATATVATAEKTAARAAAHAAVVPSVAANGLKRKLTTSYSELNQAQQMTMMMAPQSMVAPPKPANTNQNRIDKMRQQHRQQQQQQQRQKQQALENVQQPQLPVTADLPPTVITIQQPNMLAGQQYQQQMLMPIHFNQQQTMPMQQHQAHFQPQPQPKIARIPQAKFRVVPQPPPSTSYNRPPTAGANAAQRVMPLKSTPHSMSPSLATQDVFANSTMMDMAQPFAVDHGSNIIKIENLNGIGGAISKPAGSNGDGSSSGNLLQLQCAVALPQRTSIVDGKTYTTIYPPPSTSYNQPPTAGANAAQRVMPLKSTPHSMSPSLATQAVFANSTMMDMAKPFAGSNGDGSSSGNLLQLQCAVALPQRTSIVDGKTYTTIYPPPSTSYNQPPIAGANAAQRVMPLKSTPHSLSPSLVTQDVFANSSMMDMAQPFAGSNGDANLLQLQCAVALPQRTSIVDGKTYTTIYPPGMIFRSPKQVEPLVKPQQQPRQNVTGAVNSHAMVNGHVQAHPEKIFARSLVVRQGSQVMQQQKKVPKGRRRRRLHQVPPTDQQVIQKLQQQLQMLQNGPTQRRDPHKIDILVAVKSTKKTSGSKKYKTPATKSEEPNIEPIMRPVLNPGDKEESYAQPDLSMPALIQMALVNAVENALPVSQIYAFVQKIFPYYKFSTDKWHNSIRHSLSNNRGTFKMVETLPNVGSCGLWTFIPENMLAVQRELREYPEYNFPCFMHSMESPKDWISVISGEHRHSFTIDANVLATVREHVERTRVRYREQRERMQIDENVVQPCNTKTPKEPKDPNQPKRKRTKKSTAVPKVLTAQQMQDELLLKELTQQFLTKTNMNAIHEVAITQLQPTVIQMQASAEQSKFATQESRQHIEPANGTDEPVYEVYEMLEITDGDDLVVEDDGVDPQELQQPAAKRACPNGVFQTVQPQLVYQLMPQQV